MTEVFADTYYFIALLNPSDSAHQNARQFTTNQTATLVTTAWVITELANSLAKRESRQGFIKVLQALAANPKTVLIRHEERLYSAGIELYRARRDKNWSLTDCISFVVMKERGIANALTGDHHFAQAGFNVLL